MGKRRINTTESIRIERIWSMPNKNTFEIRPIAALLSEEVDTSRYWIDPFANRNKLASVTNDLNTDYDTDYHLDALDFLRLFEDESVDGVLYDPPYSPRQVSECYNDVGYNVTWDTTKASFWGNHKREISRIVKIGGKVITFGWNSGGIGYKYGFEIQRILMVPHGGWHNDTICTVEIKTHEGVTDKKPVQKMENNVQNESQILSDEDIKLIDVFKSLPNDYWDFKEDDTREYTHGLHSYPAVMVCPISRNIIKIVERVQPVNALFDPYAGSGTVLVEGMLAGIDDVCGNDINPLALLLEKVKTTPIERERLAEHINALLTSIDEKRVMYSAELGEVDDYIVNEIGLDLTARKGWGDQAPKYLIQYCSEKGLNIDVPDFKNIGYWFRPRVILELSIIKSSIEEITDVAVRDFFFVTLSEIIRLVSNRRNGEFKMFRMRADKVAQFNPDVFSQFVDMLRQNADKMQDFCMALEAKSVHSRVTIYRNDSRTLDDIPDGKYDLIITSPPYGDSRTTVAYGQYSRLSLQWINPTGLADRDIMVIDKTLLGGKQYRNGFEFIVKSETLKRHLEAIKDIDLQRAGDVYSFYEDLDASLKSIAIKTKKGGYHFWVVGNRTVKTVLLLTDVIITEIAPQYGLIHVHTIDRNIPNKVMPARNSPSNVTGATSSTMTTEHIVVLRKI